MEKNFKNFIWLGASVFIALIIIIALALRYFIAPKESIFFLLATAIIISWILLLTLYYIWAIYFYNINMGWTDKDWDDQKEKIQVEGTSDEPENNPNKDETLGLPPGTVRGTIALSVLVGGLAMLIASLAMPDKIKENELLIDHFEYIKTAFLMVIAFYFGSKSLETLGRKQVFGERSAASSQSNEERRNAATGTTAISSNGQATQTERAAQPDFFDPNAKG